MPEPFEVRADFDRDTIVVYQAYNSAIADAALKAGRFAPPFSLNRMTWIKPSFLWMMERSGWGTRSGQERTLGIRISRAGWDRALSLAVLTSYTPRVHASLEAWHAEFAASKVRVQWDPERSLHGGKLEHRSIQVGLSRAIVEEYVSTWTQEIVDLSPLVAKLRRMRQEGEHAKAKLLLPPERVYPVADSTGKKLGMA